MNDQKNMNSGKISNVSRVVSERGQTVIPKPYREYLNLKSGDHLEWALHESGHVMVKPVKKKRLKDLQGIIEPKVPVENLDEAIRQSRQEHYEKRNRTEKNQ